MTLTRHLPDAGATAALGAALAVAPRPGDVVCLHGDLGAGKTTLARALVQAAQAAAGVAVEEVPSPTFTLVQTYDAGGVEIWHYDLYRVASPAEMEDLGWDEATAGGIVLVEWPERLGDLMPADRLDIALVHDGDTRMATITPQGGFRTITA